MMTSRIANRVWRIEAPLSRGLLLALLYLQYSLRCSHVPGATRARGVVTLLDSQIVASPARRIDIIFGPPRAFASLTTSRQPRTAPLSRPTHAISPTCRSVPCQRHRPVGGSRVLSHSDAIETCWLGIVDVLGLRPSPARCAGFPRAGLQAPGTATFLVATGLRAP